MNISAAQTHSTYSNSIMEDRYPSVSGLQTRVLIVDDDPNIGAALEVLLRREPYEIHSVDSPALAWSLLEECFFDVILTDEKMPQFNGSALLSLVREFYPDTGRILMTGQADLRSVIEALNLRHASRLLIKPCGKDELIHAINCACDPTD